MTDSSLGRAYLMVHFDPATGVIKQTGFGYSFFDVPGCLCGELPEGTDIYNLGPRYRVDLSSLEQRDGLPPLVQLIEDPLN